MSWDETKMDGASDSTGSLPAAEYNAFVGSFKTIYGASGSVVAEYGSFNENLIINGTSTITNAGTNNGLFIDQNGNGQGILIDSEATGAVAIRSQGRYAGQFVQDISNGYGLSVSRNVSEVGTTPLVTFSAGNASDGQPALKIEHSGVGSGIDMTNTTIANIKLASFNGEVNHGDSGTGVEVDWRGGNNQKVRLTDNCLITFVNPNKPARLQLRLNQDSTGNRTVTWPTNIFWVGGALPTLSTAAEAIDIVTFWWEGNGSYFSVASNAFSKV